MRNKQIRSDFENFLKILFNSIDRFDIVQMLFLVFMAHTDQKYRFFFYFSMNFRMNTELKKSIPLLNEKDLIDYSKLYEYFEQRSQKNTF